MKLFGKVGKRSLVILLALVLVLSIAFACGSIINESRLDKIQQELLVELEQNAGGYNEQRILLSNTSKARAEKLAKQLNASLRMTENGEFAALTLQDGVTVEQVAQDKSYRKYLSELSLDYKVRLASLEDGTGEEDTGLTKPNYRVEDAYYHQQTYLDYINVGDAWQQGLGKYADGTKVTVAVIDTGIDTDHPEFIDAEGNTIISTKSYDATNDKTVEMYDWSVIEDENGHGTAVEGVIAAQMNTYGIAGIAPDVELLVIKCETNEYGELSSAEITFAIYYAIEQDVAVINMSLGGAGGGTILLNLLCNWR